MASQNCALLQLPLEVRLQIFSSFFTGLRFQFFSQRKAIAQHDLPMRYRGRHNFENVLALLGVNRQIRAEAMPLVGESDVMFTAMFEGMKNVYWHTLDLPQSHTAAIKVVTMHFLDSNFAVLRFLPNLSRLLIEPVGELRCGALDVVWTLDKIYSPPGAEAISQELFASIKLLHTLNDQQRSESDLPDTHERSFEILFLVSMKFLIAPLRRSSTGRRLWNRADFHRLTVDASATYYSQRPCPASDPGDIITIHSLDRADT